MLLRYAVLAPVSGRYSPLEGRLLTCYSPVRHSMHSPKRALIVRLACLRHAASVDSEPGSNSHVKAIAANTPLGAPRQTPHARANDWLHCVVGCLVCRHDPDPRGPERTQLSLDGLVRFAFYLVFKEPTASSVVVPTFRGTFQSSHHARGLSTPFLPAPHARSRRSRNSAQPRRCCPTAAEKMGEALRRFRPAR